MHKISIAHFIKVARLTMKATRANSNPHLVSDDGWARTASHWKCTIKRGSRQITVPFSQGEAHKDPPTLPEVLDCLASDASGYLNAATFEDWASELGFDTDSRKAEHTYRTVEVQTAQLGKLLGEELIMRLTCEVERH